MDKRSVHIIKTLLLLLVVISALLPFNLTRTVISERPKPAMNAAASKLVSHDKYIRKNTAYTFTTKFVFKRLLQLVAARYDYLPPFISFLKRDTYLFNKSYSHI